MERKQEKMRDKDEAVHDTPAAADPGTPAKQPTEPASAATTAPTADVPVKPATAPGTGTEKPAKPAAVSNAAPAQGDDYDVIAAIPVEPWPRSKPSTPPTSALPVADPVPAAVEAPSRPAAVTAARNRVFGSYDPVPEPSPAARERRAAREAALDTKPPLARFLQTVLGVIYPFLLLIGAVRLIASSAFLWVVYQRAGFPVDSFGFSTADRLTFGAYGVDYLNNTADSRYLGGLRDVAGAPMFLESEVAHMSDVKDVIGYTYLAGIILAVLALICLIYLGKRYAGGIRRGLFAGSVATIGLIAVLGGLAIWNWEGFFTSFHQMFFANGTWTFSYSDTLIRLYPPQFWVDAGIGIGALVLGAAILTLIITWPTARRRERSRLAQQARVFGLS